MSKWNFVAMGQVGLTGWTQGGRQASRPFDRPQYRTAGGGDPVAYRCGIPRDDVDRFHPNVGAVIAAGRTGRQPANDPPGSKRLGDKPVGRLAAWDKRRTLGAQRVPKTRGG
jgi:hypothetical protein